MTTMYELLKLLQDASRLINSCNIPLFINEQEVGKVVVNLVEGEKGIYCQICYTPLKKMIAVETRKNREKQGKTGKNREK